MPGCDLDPDGRALLDSSFRGGPKDLRKGEHEQNLLQGVQAVQSTHWEGDGGHSGGNSGASVSFRLWFL